MDGAARIARYREDKRKKRALQKAKWWSENKHSIDRQIANADRPVSSAAAKKRLERQRKKDTRLKERERKRDYRRRKKDEQLTTPNQKTQTFANRMSKSHAVRKLSSALPTTPMKRIDTLKTYLSKTKSPTVKHSHKDRMIWPSGTSDGNEARENNMKIANIKEIVQTTKKQRSPEALMVMNSLTTATCSNNMNKTNVCRKLGLNKKRQRKGVVKREKVLTSTNAALINTARKAKSDALSLETKKRVFDFWTEPGVSRPTGNKNDVKRIRTGTNEYTTHPVHILEKTQAEVYSDFKNKHPDIKISTRSFEKLKPFFVLPVRQKDKETCCCRYHVEIRSVFKTCMDYRKKLLKTKSNPEINVYDSLNDLIKDSLCPKETGALTHKNVCLERKCEKCGVKNIKFLDEELSSSEGADEVKWEKYEYKNIAKGEKTVRKLMLTKQCTKVGVMFKYFKDIIGSFAEHSFRAQWQNQQMKALIESLPLNQCLAIHDYSESYRCFDKQELQSGYFQKNEVSLQSFQEYSNYITAGSGPIYTCILIVPLKNYTQFFTIHLFVLSAAFKCISVKPQHTNPCIL